MQNDDIKFMELALAEAKKALLLEEVPVGAVIVKDGKVISTGYNKRETEKSALLHAEMIAIDKACTQLGGWRLWECEMYVTLEPCPMCSGAIINSRLKRVVYGADDQKAGCCGSVTNLFEMPFNHKPLVEKGVCQDQASELLSAFFEILRQKNQTKDKWKKNKSTTD